LFGGKWCHRCCGNKQWGDEEPLGERRENEGRKGSERKEKENSHRSNYSKYAVTCYLYCFSITVLLCSKLLRKVRTLKANFFDKHCHIHSATMVMVDKLTFKNRNNE